MSHRAEQVVNAAASILEAHALLGAAGVEVYKHRVLSLSEVDQELPAVSITFGDDAPFEDDGASNMAFFDSLQTLAFRIVVRGQARDDEAAIISALQDMRRAIHVALMADYTLGLAWVIGTRYGGADAPAVDASEAKLCGMMDCRWSIHYRMNFADPQ